MNKINNEIKMNKKLPKQLFDFILHFLTPYKFAVFIYVFVCVCTGCLGSIHSLLIKKIINLLPLISTENIYLLTWPAILMVLNFLIFDNVTWRTLKYINYKFQAVIKNKIISELLDYTLMNQNQFFQNNFSGTISKQITTLAENVEIILFRITRNFIKAIMTLILAFIVAWSVNNFFFYILILWFLIFTSFSVFISNHLVYLSNNVAESESLLSSTASTRGNSTKLPARLYSKVYRLYSAARQYL